MRYRPEFLQRIVTIVLIVIVLGPNAFAQLSSSSFRRVLVEETGLTAEELLALDQHKIVVKILPVKLKQEIAVLGIVRLNEMSFVSMPVFRDSLDQAGSSDYSGGGKLNLPPTLDDLSRLRFEDKDLADLKNCVVGNCKVKLPAHMIRSLTTEIDSNAPNHDQLAAVRLKQFLVEYAEDYLVRGDEALIEYADKKKPVKLAEEYRTLTEELRIVKAMAPEFVTFLLNFPSGELQGAENRLDWSKVRSGLKPVISLTHGTSYAKLSDNNAMLFVATKQLYANHYIDASLSLASLIQFQSGDDVESYLIFENRSRSDALGGLLGEMVRGSTEIEVQKRVKELLDRTAHRIAVKAQGPPVIPEVEIQEGLFSRMIRIAGNPVFLLIAFLVILTISIVFLVKLKR